MNPPPRATEPVRGQPRYTNLQAELDKLRGVPHEHNPARRPLVLSERAATCRDWLLRALDRGYAQGGHTNSQWDPLIHAAFVAYADYTHAGTTLAHYAVLTNAVLVAAASGCGDPMVRYMQVRYGLVDTSARPELFALASLQAFRGLWDSPYHPLLKFMAGYRAVDAARQVDVNGDRSTLLSFVTTSLEDSARDTNAPPEEVFEAAGRWVEHTPARGWVDMVLSDLQSIMERNWSREEAYFRFRGQAEIARAWNERGSGYANTVTAEGWAGFNKHLEQAEPFLDTAWKMNPSNAYTAYLMMKLELGQSRGRERMEQWFERAMALDTNYYDAASLMSYYLEPRWHGSVDEALEFARRCVTSTNWGGQVPLVLPQLHHSLAKFKNLAESPDYWQRPEVWEDVRSGYERFFQLNPDAFAYRHNYAGDAFLCGHYAEFLAQTKLFGFTNFQFFGGQERFRRMLAKAAANTTDSVPK